MNKRFSGMSDADGEFSEDDAPGAEKTAIPEDNEEVNLRIAQAGRLVREEAKRLLAQEKIVRKRQPVRRPARLPTALADGLDEEEKLSLVEVTDKSDRPLVCISPESAIRQKLPCRLVSVAMQRGKSRLILHKNRDPRLGGAGCWDMHTAFVLVGEAREDAAHRVLRLAGIEGLGVNFLGIAPQEEGRLLRTSYFKAELPAGLYPTQFFLPGQAGREQREIAGQEAGARNAQVLEVDADELEGITAAAPELFSPELLWAARTGLLLEQRKPR